MPTTGVVNSWRGFWYWKKKLQHYSEICIKSYK